MCQNWFSVIGQLFDVVGFLVIAWEWFHQFQRDHDRRIRELEKASQRQQASYEGRRPPPQDEDAAMWREFQRLFLKEWRWRRKVFFTGAGLVILGFLFQVLGNWPHLIRSC